MDKGLAVLSNNCLLLQSFGVNNAKIDFECSFNEIDV